jgi:hypothetical protein
MKICFARIFRQKCQFRQIFFRRKYFKNHNIDPWQIWRQGQDAWVNRWCQSGWPDSANFRL